MIELTQSKYEFLNYHFNYRFYRFIESPFLQISPDVKVLKKNLCDEYDVMRFSSMSYFSLSLCIKINCQNVLNVTNIKNLTKYYYTLDIALRKMSSHIKVYFVWDKKF